MGLRDLFRIRENTPQEQREEDQVVQGVVAGVFDPTRGASPEGAGEVAETGSDSDSD